MNLFEFSAQKEAALQAPLAERMRPKTLEDWVGQGHLTGPGQFLRQAIERDQIPSLILWGPPGSGKTTLARIMAERTGAEFISLSAVLGGIKDIREAVQRAREAWQSRRRRTLLFVDEIHRFNKAQQDALLPHVENGTLTLIGATTENPSFEVNSALLSRTRVLTLNRLEDDDVLLLLRRSLSDARGLDNKVEVTEEALRLIAHAASGDARKALTALEVASMLNQGPVTLESAQQALQTKTLLYDKHAEEHHHVVSAFIKSMRGSDVDAALYWMARMLESGEEPRFVLRRMVIFASEDIGNADPQALTVALNALQAYTVLGLPEGALPLTQAVTYLSLAPKANTVLTSWANAQAAVKAHGALAVPTHLRNAPTSLMKSLGFGAGYQYPHDFEGNHVPERYLPKELLPSNFYQPSQNGLEAELRRRHEALKGRLPREVGEEG